MLFVSCFVILLALSYASSLQKLSSAADHERISNQTKDNWALLISTSNGYENYAMQADACHAYQVLRAHGIPDDHIVVMMADDIAYNSKNPYKGEIFNQPGGGNVYANVPKDYTGKDITVSNFFNIMMGNKQAMKGIGSGKVIESGSLSNVFISMGGHGTTGLVAFESPDGYSYNEYLRADQLNQMILDMYSRGKYFEMVMYLDSCESGSMFDRLLPSDIWVYAASASKPLEDSYNCYWNNSVGAFLGGRFTTNWMEYVDQYGTSKTLKDQFQYAVENTPYSHPQQYGYAQIQYSSISAFMGSKQITTYVSSHEKDKHGVPSPDVPIAILLNKIASETDDAKKALLEQQLSDELQLRKDIRSTVYNIAAKLATTKEHLTELLQTSSLPRNFDCIEDSVKLFFKRCFKNKKSEYALKQARVLVNLCEMQGMDWKQIEDAITSTC